MCVYIFICICVHIYIYIYIYIYIWQIGDKSIKTEALNQKNLNEDLCTAK